MIHRLAAVALAFLAASSSAMAAPRAPRLDAIARDYVKMSLEAGEREAGYVDAYYGPPEWAEAAKAAPRTVPQLRAEAARLSRALAAIPLKSLDRQQQRRRAFLAGQLTAAQTRLAMHDGEKFSFAQEAQGLFGVAPPIKPLASYDPVLARIEKLIPGNGPLAERVDAFQNRYVIPKDRLEPVMKAAIAECRARTQAHIALPADERFDLSFVTNKPWSGYNWYKGAAHSLIEINTDLPVFISRAVDLGCHEGYPGHHVLNLLLEEKLTKEKGWVEFSINPLFSPGAVVAEGSANFGIDLAFPGAQKLAFERDVLYPLAGLDPATASAFDALLQAKRDLAQSEITIAADYLDGKLSRDAAIDALAKYGLSSRARAEKRLSFIDTYRSYIINYSFGRDRVEAYVDRAGRSSAARWARMQAVISEPTTPADLLR